MMWGAAAAAVRHAAGGIPGDAAAAAALAAAAAALLLLVLLAPPAGLWAWGEENSCSAASRPCEITITPFIMPVTYDGGVRNNPDRSYYPGDAFHFAFKITAKSDCKQFNVWPLAYREAISLGHALEDEESERGFGEWVSGLCRGEEGKFVRCLSGHAEIATALTESSCKDRPLTTPPHPDDPGDACWPPYDRLVATASGVEMRCFTVGDGGCRCGDLYTQRSRTIAPTILPPHVDVLFTQPPLNDTDGYAAKNRDGTYYVHDPVNVVHEPVFRWKDHRAATIQFGIDSVQGLHPNRSSLQAVHLTNETSLQCAENSCAMTLRHPGTRASGWAFGNGEGLTVWNATGYGQLGLHAMDYTVDVYNIGRKIGSASNQTGAMIADYAPAYDRHAYPVLKDGARYAYDDGQGIAMLYHGSWGNGTDDDGALHPDRRSKINAWYPNTTARSEGSTVVTLQVDPSLLAWHSAGHVNGTDPGAFLSEGDGHAMFEGTGYGIVRLWQGISGLVLSEEGRRNLYANVTTLNAVASDGFAGHDSYGLFNYTYRYPHAPLAMWYNMTLHGPDGAAVQGVRMSAEATVLPPQGGNVTRGPDWNATAAVLSGPMPPGGVTVAEVDAYMYAKSLRDTGDPHLAAAARDDAYGMAGAAAGGEGDGTLGMWLNRTGLEFRAGYAVPPGQAITDIPRHAALGMGAPVGVNMTAGDRSVTRAFSFTFENPYLERIHLGGAGVGAGDNATGGPQPGERPPLLNATRVGDGGAGGGSGPMPTSLVELRVPEWFGTITAVRVDGVPARQSLDCRGPHSCTVDVPSGPANVTVTNAWGAEATAEVGEPRTMAVAAPEETADNSAHYVAFVLVAALVAYVAYAALRRAAAAATGQEGDGGYG